ncbi:MAG: flippase, partial [Clostridia bacterium]|nr:flippase [Clostridia bacterium]
MAEKSIKKNFIFNIFYQVFALITPLIVTPYVSRVLGADGIGQYSYANSILSYFNLFAVLGTGLYGQRAIGYTQLNKIERSRKFAEVFLLRLTTSSIMLVAYAVFVFVAVGKSNETEFIIYLILAFNLINVVLDITWFFQGMEEFGKTVSTSTLIRILSLVSIFVFVKSTSDLWVYVLIMVAQTVLGNIVLWCLLPKYICKVKDVHPFKDLKTIIALFLPTIATQIYVVLDKSMIGWFTDGYFENGYYEQAEKVVKITLSAVTALGTVMIPRIARYFKEGNTEGLKYYIYKSYRFIWLMAIPIMIGLSVVADFFVPIFFGEGYDKCSLLIPILSCLTILIGLSNVTGIQYFVPTGKQNVLTMTVVVGAVVNLIFNLILIPKFASVGASIASIIAEFSVTLAGIIYVKKTKQFEIKRIFTESWKYWIDGIVMGV